MQLNMVYVKLVGEFRNRVTQGSASNRNSHEGKKSFLVPCLFILSDFGQYRKIIVKSCNIHFRSNPFGRSCFVEKYKLTEGHDEANSHFRQLLYYTPAFPH